MHKVCEATNDMWIKARNRYTKTSFFHTTNHKFVLAIAFDSPHKSRVSIAMNLGHDNLPTTFKMVEIHDHHFMRHGGEKQYFKKDKSYTSLGQFKGQILIFATMMGYCRIGSRLVVQRVVPKHTRCYVC